MPRPSTTAFLFPQVAETHQINPVLLATSFLARDERLQAEVGNANAVNDHLKR